MPDFSYEDAALASGHGLICGVDEAGRGTWAGPVVAAAVILDRAVLPALTWAAGSWNLRTDQFTNLRAVQSQMTRKMLHFFVQF